MRVPFTAYNGQVIFCDLGMNKFLGRTLIEHQQLFTLFGRRYGWAIALDKRKKVHLYKNDVIDYISQYFRVQIYEDTVGAPGLGIYREWARGMGDRNYPKTGRAYYDLLITCNGKIIPGGVPWALELLRIKVYKPCAVNDSKEYCSIGYCPQKKGWYGWNHRAVGFYGIGKVLDGDDVATQSPYEDEYIEKHPELDFRMPIGKILETSEDCRNAAIAFVDALR